MSFIDKIKSKLKSSSAEDLLAGVPQIKKQAKEFEADQVTLAKEAHKALGECSTQSVKLRKGGADGYTANKRDYELSVGQLERQTVDYKNFYNSHLAFMMSMLEVRDTLDKLASKEKDARKLKAIKDGSKDLTDLFNDHNKILGKGLLASLEKAIKEEKATIEDAAKRYNKLTDAIDNLCMAVIRDTKSATKYFEEVEKLAAEIDKRCKKMDLKNAVAALSALRDRLPKHASFVPLQKAHEKKMADQSGAAGFEGTTDAAKVVISPRMKKEYDAALLTYKKEEIEIVKIEKAATEQVRKLKTEAGFPDRK